MSAYHQVQWLPLCGGLTLLGLIASWLLWRRRGAAAGLRGVAWSLLPLAAYLVGVIELLWRFGIAIAAFATSFVFSPLVWSGVIVLAVSVVLFGVSGVMRRRSKAAGGRPGAQSGTGTGGAPAAGRAPGTVAVKGGKRKPGGDANDDLADVAEILKRHGIR